MAALPLVLVLAACGAGGPRGSTAQTPDGPSAAASPARQPLIIDVDMEASDVYTLAYALTLPDHDVRAVTVTGTGVGTCPAGAANAAAIAAVMGRPDIPVACGSSEPIGLGHAFPDPWRAAADALYGISLPPARPTDEPATELMARVLEGSPAPVDILVVGPMTNLAQVLADRPSLAANVRRVVAMAGAVDAEGNVGANLYPGSPEWNVWADPAATAAVLESGVPVVLVPLDATNLVPIDADWFATLETSHGTAGASLTYELLARNPFMLTGGQFWWDPLAATFLERPDVLQLEERTIRVRATPGREFGRTVVDPTGQTVSVAVGADPLAFEEAFSAGLGRGGPRGDGWEVAGRVTVTYDGRNCAIGGDPVTAGSLAVRVENATQATLLVTAVTLHPGATWAELQAYVETLEEHEGNPEFVDLVFITPAPGSAQVVDLPAGSGGFACVEQDDEGVPTRVVLSEEHELGG
jgi:inosine-uridine nucleoside N-ribohydrolase